ncbi:MAG: hypothetical protein GY788_01660, partial [bacterium]|nr:hypothetical protein [bacterium]
TTDLDQRKATIDLDAGETVTCTFTNTTPQGTIEIVKDAVPDAEQDFGFAGDLGTFTLDDDEDPTLPRSRTFTKAAGTYMVTEDVVEGWDLTNIVCVDPDEGSTTDLDQRKATIDLDAGETVTCTFTNTTPQGTIEIVKDAVPDDEQDFGFAGDLGTFTLDDDEDPTLPR